MPFADSLRRKEYLRKYKLSHRAELAERERQRYLITYIPHPRPKMSEEHKTQKKAEEDRKYRKKHKNKIAKLKRKWQQANMDKICRYMLEKRRTNIHFRITCNLRSRTSRAVRKEYKSGSAVSDLGCSVEYFRNYISELFSHGMSWNNYGRWHLDHIIPLCHFDLTNRNEFLKAAHYSNYQPLWAEDNCRKNKHHDFHSQP